MKALSPLSSSRSSVRPLLAMALVGLIAWTLLALAWPVVAAAQGQPSLAEIARKEAERRKTVKDAKKVITAKDLPESARRPVSPPATAGGGATAAPAGAAGPPSPPSNEHKPAPAAGTAPPSGQQDEASWRRRIAQAREGLRRNESFLEALQSRVNGLTTDFVNRDDPYQRAKIGEDRQKALEEMGRVKADIELSKKQIADIEEEARKAGVPPGWLR